MTEDSVEQPFLTVPPDDDVAVFDSITSWPSLSESVTSDQTHQSSVDTMKLFRALTTDVQREFVNYPAMVTQAFHEFAASGDSINTVEWIVEKMPAMLFRPDQYGYIPIEAALESGNGPAVRLMLRVADGCGLLQKLLSYRNPRYHRTLLMLAVNLNSEECADIMRTLFSCDPAGVHRFYDNEGKNVFHRCTEGGFEISFRQILELVIEFRSTSMDSMKNDCKGSLEMTDTKRYSPLHYISACGKICMFNDLRSFCTAMGMELDFDVYFKGSGGVTPLMVGVEKGHVDICKWLLQSGLVSVNQKQHSTCLTALHFAVRAGNHELISLLRCHGADAEFVDSDCDELRGYKTPLEMARTEDIPNKRACIASLTEPPALSAQTDRLSGVILSDKK